MLLEFVPSPLRSPAITFGYHRPKPWWFPRDATTFIAPIKPSIGLLPPLLSCCQTLSGETSHRLLQGPHQDLAAATNTTPARDATSRRWNLQSGPPAEASSPLPPTPTQLPSRRRRAPSLAAARRPHQSFLPASVADLQLKQSTGTPGTRQE